MRVLYCSGLFYVYDLESVKRVNKFSYKLQLICKEHFANLSIKSCLWLSNSYVYSQLLALFVLYDVVLY